MGILTLSRYKGAQVLEAAGGNHEVMAMCFPGTARSPRRDVRLNPTAVIPCDSCKTLSFVLTRVKTLNTCAIPWAHCKTRMAPANPLHSRMKHVASGRFGVTMDDLAHADQIQIKTAQGLAVTSST